MTVGQNNDEHTFEHGVITGIVITVVVVLSAFGVYKWSESIKDRAAREKRSKALACMNRLSKYRHDQHELVAEICLDGEDNL